MKFFITSYFSVKKHKLSLPLILILATISLGQWPQPALAATWTPDTSSTTKSLVSVSCVDNSFCKAGGGKAPL